MKRGDQGWIPAYPHRSDSPYRSVRIVDLGVYADGMLYVIVRDENHVPYQVPGHQFTPRGIVITEEPDLADL